jgi:hypothetical protein
MALRGRATVLFGLLAAAWFALVIGAIVGALGNMRSIGVLMLPVGIAFSVGAMRTRAALFSDRIEYRNFFGPTHTIPLDAVDEAFIQTRSSGEGSNRFLFVVSNAHEVQLAVSQFSSRQRDAFASALGRAVAARRAGRRADPQSLARAKTSLATLSPSRR